VDSGASENICKAEWVREHHIPTVCFLKINTGLNWQMIVQLGLARDYDADAMAKLVRQQLAYLFMIGLREVQVAVDDINTDQQTELTNSLQDSMNEVTDIIKEPDGLPPTRECDFEINLECDEPPTAKERT
jgi:hypothetical protein